MKKKTPKQIAALICVVLLVSLYLITFLWHVWAEPIPAVSLPPAWSPPSDCLLSSGSLSGSTV